MLAPTQNTVVPPLRKEPAASFTDRAATVFVRELRRAAIVYPIIALVGAVVAFGVGVARPDLARPAEAAVVTPSAAGPVIPKVAPEKLEGPAVVLTRPGLGKPMPVSAPLPAMATESASASSGPTIDMPKRMPIGSTN